MIAGMNGPIRPLTEAQQRVANLIAKGYDAHRVASELHVETCTVRAHVVAIANLIPNPDDIAPYRLVMLWAAHHRWLTEHHCEPPRRTA